MPKKDVKLLLSLEEAKAVLNASIQGLRFVRGPNRALCEAAHIRLRKAIHKVVDHEIAEREASKD